MTSETTPTTLRDREPGTEAGRTFTEGSYQEMRRLMGDRPYSTLDVVLAIEEQAATEARRELRPRIHDLLRGSDDPANWGVPEDYAAGWIAAVHAAEQLLEQP